MSRTLLFFCFLVGCCLLLGALLQHGSGTKARLLNDLLPGKRQLVKQLGLTDLALWSEARYTRHPSQADLFTAFQDYPGAFDHFPAGSIISPGTPQRNTSLSFRKKGHL